MSKRATKPYPTPDQLRSLVDYDPETGIFLWRRRDQSNCPGDKPGWLERWNKLHAGEPALNAMNSQGYLFGLLLGWNIRANRAAWAYVHGQWPSTGVDHRNGDHRDNRIGNLRLADAVENGRNMGISRRNKSGVVGVFRNRQGGWVANIRAEGKTHHLGTFATLEAASEARRQAEVRYGFQPQHGKYRAAEKRYIPKSERS